MVSTISYRSGQTYNFADEVSARAAIARAEAGAIFSYPAAGGLTGYLQAQLQQDTVDKLELVPYNPLLATAVELAGPPTDEQIQAASEGDLFSFFGVRSIIFYIVVTIDGRNFVVPFSYTQADQRNSRFNQELLTDIAIFEWPIAAWPHVSTVDENIIFRWGRQKYISRRRADGRIFFDDYIENISWPLNTVWQPPATEAEAITVDWSDVTAWSGGNTQDWLIVGAGSDLLAATNLAYINFAGYIGWICSVRITQSGVSLTNADAPRLTPEGFELTVKQGQFAIYRFEFSSPIRLDRLDFTIDSASRPERQEYGGEGEVSQVRNVSSGPLVIRSVRMPRYADPLWKSNVLLGGLSEVEEIVGPVGYVAGVVGVQSPVADIYTTEIVKAFEIQVDNRQFPDNSVIKLINWQVHYVNTGILYRVDYDLANKNFIGRPIRGGEPVVLEYQNSREGWTQVEDSVIGMDYSPDLRWDRTEGFYRAESFWSSTNGTMWRSQKDDIGDASWFEQSVNSLCHPFGGVKLTTYLDIAGGAADPNILTQQGLYFGKTTETFSSVGFTFYDDHTNISLLSSTDREGQGYPMPSISFDADPVGPGSASITAGNYNAQNLRLALTLRNAEFEEYFKPGGDVTLSGGNAFYNAKGGNVNIIAGSSLGEDMPGGNIQFLIPAPLDSNALGFSPRTGVLTDREGDLGYVEFGCIFNDIKHLTRFPRGVTVDRPQVGDSLKVARIEDTGTEKISYLDWSPSGKIVRSALDPTFSFTRPSWEIWYKETTRALYKFTHANVGGLYQPIEIPWCCSPVKEYQLLKPLTVVRSATLPDPEVATTRPSWQFWIVETETELRIFTWARSRGRFRLLPMPISMSASGGQLVPEFVLTKPEAGAFDEIEPSDNPLIVRKQSIPADSTTRPTWEFYIWESLDLLRWYVVMKVGDTYKHAPLPWSISVSENGTIINEFELTKPERSFGAMFFSDFPGDVVNRSNLEPETSDMAPPWEFWIHDRSGSIKWFTRVFLENRYVPVELPWIARYDAATRTLVYETEALK